MAISNSTTLNDLVGQIVTPDVMSYWYSTRVMRPLVRSYAVPPGNGSMVVPKFGALTVSALTEGVAPTSTPLSTDGVTLTPTERGTYVDISKRVLHADPFESLSPYGEQLGRALGQDEDALILDVASTFTTVLNNTGGADDIDLGDFRTAVATLEASNVPGPYYAVFHPVSWAKMRALLSDAGVWASVGTGIVEGFGPGFTNMAGYVGSPYGIPTFISTQVNTTDAGATYQNVFFSRDAIACAYIADIRVDVDDNIVARKIDLMAWYSIDCEVLQDGAGLILEDSVS